MESIYPGEAAKTQTVRRRGFRANESLYSPLVSDTDLKAQCIFLSKGRCSVHQAKPLQCRLYPFFPLRLSAIEEFTLKLDDLIVVESEAGTRYVISVDQDCRGVSEAPGGVDWQEIVRISEHHERESADAGP